MPRRATFLSIGTHGDLFPNIALAEALRATGVCVTFATHGRYESLVRSRGLDFVPVAVDPEEIMRRGLSLDRGDWDPDRLEGPLEDLIEVAWAACRSSDCVLVSPMFLAGGFVAEALNIPSISVSLQPSTPAVVSLNQRVRHPFNLWLKRRTGKSLPAADLLVRAAAGHPVHLYGYSTEVLPDLPDHLRWPHRALITGYWFADPEPDEDLGTDLSAFLDAGEKPLLVTFGSTMDLQQRELWRLVQAGLRESGRRAVIVTSWAGRDGLESDDRVFVVDHAPYSVLLPRIELAVHHAGAGTTAAVLRAGIPSVPIPCLFDQFLWADAIARLGAGTHPIYRRFLTSTRLAASIEAAISNPRFRKRSRELGKRIDDERGVEVAVRHVLETMQ